MVASQLREPRPASPDPYQPNRAHERVHRRPANRPQSATGRQPKLNLDSLAIGAPLTAALIGVLLTEGDAAFGAATAGSADGDAAARRDHDEEGVTSQGGGEAARLGPAARGLKGEAAPSTGGEILDPVAAEGAATPATAAGAAGGGTLAPPGAAATGSDGETVLSGGTSITLGAGGPLGDLGLDGGVGDANGAQSDGRIGAAITGSDGDDAIHGTPHDDRLLGGAGDDVIHGHEGDDLLDGGAGDDQLFGGPGNDSLLGGAGHDLLDGGTGDDDLLGGTGNDQLFGGSGQDELDGGPGNDLLDGGTGADQMQGGTGNDVLTVDHLHDVALDNVPGPNGGGSDVLRIDDGFSASLVAQGRPADVTFVFSDNLGVELPAGTESYTQQVASGVEHVVLAGSADHDVIGDGNANQITGNDGDNKLHGGGGDDILHGGGGNDVLQGGAGADELRGDAGNDQLFGGSGDDILHGAAGDDVLYGEAGADLLYGGAGNDNYVIGLNDSAIDTVFDHEGQNWLTIEGGAGHRVQTALVGDQLHVVVDDAVVAVVDSYRGNEDAFVGIDTGAGLRTIDELMAPGGPQDPPPAEASPAATTSHTEDDLLGAYLTQPSLQGTAGDDHLVGTSDSDWLVGGAGNDHLIGGAGDDILQGGRGSDLLEGGAGDDRYLFKAGDGGLSTIIRDSEGANVAELDGFGDAPVAGRVIDQNLVVIANYAPLFTFEDFVLNEQAFAGVQIGDQFIATEDLLA